MLGGREGGSGRGREGKWGVYIHALYLLTLHNCCVHVHTNVIAFSQSPIAHSKSPTTYIYMCSTVHMCQRKSTKPAGCTCTYVAQTATGFYRNTYVLYMCI